MLIFVLQAIWLYIKELAGKDLDVVTVLKFLFYITPTLIPLIVPLTILLSSIMVFGNFAENYEFAAMKSTGISLQRAMASLGIFIAGLGVLTFFFSNNVIPWAEFNSYNLRKNIAKVKPAMAIVEGQFTPMGDDFSIKVEHKSGENGRDLKNIIIHQKSQKAISYNTTIVAKTGVLGSDEKEADVLKLILYDGYYYDDTPPKDRNKSKRKLFNKSHFKKYTKNIDLAEINKVDVNKKDVTNRYSMLDINDLSYTIDSLKDSKSKIYSDFSSTLYKRTNLTTLNQSVNTVKDSVVYNDGLLDLFDLKKKIQIIDYALNSIRSTNQIISSKDKSIKYKNTVFNLHIIALHEKFALGFACVILFFVGAPLGALIRKGGLGLPMVIAIVLFLTYHFLGIFAKNSAKNGTIDPVFGAWFSTLIMLPLSIFLTRRATADRGIFEFDHIIEPIKQFLNIKKSAENDPNADRPHSNLDYVRDYLAEEQPETKIAQKPIHTVIQIETFKKEQKRYKTHAKNALWYWILAAVLFILFFVFKNNKLPQYASAAIQLSPIALVVHYFYLIKSLINTNAMYLAVSLPYNKNSLLNGFGFLLYPIFYILKGGKMLRDFATIR